MGLTSRLVSVGMERKLAEVAGEQLETLAAAGNSLATATAISESIIYCNSGTGGSAFGLRLPAPDKSKAGYHTLFNESGITIRLYVDDSSLRGIKGFGGVTAGGAGAYVDVANTKAAVIHLIGTDTWGAFGT